MNYLDVLSLFQTTINFLYALGFFSEMIIVIVSIYVLYGSNVDFAFFLIGVLGSSITNRLLKPIFQDPRPNRPIKFLESEEFPKKIDYTKNTNFYGMPSGHAQQVAYCLTYLYLTIDESPLFQFGTTFIGAAMLFERWWFRNHTVAQLLAGLLVGILFANFVIYLRDDIFRNQEKNH